jgi:hypothetical protein
MATSGEPQIEQLSARSIVSRMFEERSDTLDEFSLPSITNDVLDLVKQNTALLYRLVDECLRPMLYDIGLGVLSSQRAKKSQVKAISNAVRVLPEPSSEASVALDLMTAIRQRPAPPARSRSGFDWLRHPVSVAPKETVRLRRAMRGDLERAITFAGQGIESTRVTIAYYELVKEGLTNDTQTVAERYRDEDLAALWGRAERRIATEDRVFTEVKERIAARIGPPAETPTA